MSLTKRDIARAIHEAEPEISISEAVSVVDAIFVAMKDRLAAGGKVMITNFGTFQVVERAARQGINPATGGGTPLGGAQGGRMETLLGQTGGGNSPPAHVQGEGPRHLHQGHGL